MLSEIASVVPQKIDGRIAVNIGEWYPASFHFMLYNYFQKTDKSIWGNTESPPTYHELELEFNRGVADALREKVGETISNKIDTVHQIFFSRKPRGNLCKYYGCSLGVEFFSFLAKLPTQFSYHDVKDAEIYKENARGNVTDGEAREIDNLHHGFYNMLWNRLTPADFNDV